VAGDVATYHWNEEPEKRSSERLAGHGPHDFIFLERVNSFSVAWELNFGLQAMTEIAL